MVWLVTHIWLFIGLAALFGLILGWAVRGIRVSGGARRAVVERNIALTELDQVRAELDSLYTAQRVQGGDVELQHELQARDVKLGELETALTAAREDLIQYKAESEKKLLAATAASAVAAGAGAGAVMATGGQGADQAPERLDAGVNAGNAQLEWRNRYLESRVRSLETSTVEAEQVAAPPPPVVEDMSGRVAELEAGVTELETTNQALQTEIRTLEERLEAEQSRDHSLVAGAAGAALGAGAAIAGQDGLADQTTAADATDTVERDKLAWQNDYLRQRLAFMEEHGISDTTDSAPADLPSSNAPEPRSPDVPDAPAAVAVQAEPAAEPGDIEQELARLRWRNRYLEGRLAYIDGDASLEDGAGATSTDNADKTSAAEALLERLERADDS